MSETDRHDHLPHTPESIAPISLNIIIGGIVLALITLFAGAIGFLSIKQAPVHPPVVEQK